MNKHTYRVILNRIQGQHVVVSEVTRGKGKSSQGACRALAIFLAAGSALAEPTGGAVTSGNASVQTNGTTTTVRQTTQNAIVHWQSFSINSNETVRFEAPNATASTLNRVTGHLPSRIDGTLTGNGRVFLVNQNGIVVGKDGVVNVNGGFVASTQNLADSEFLGGNMRFAGGNSGRIEVLGTISSPGGDILLIAPKLDLASSAKLTAEGRIQLVAASEVSYSNGKFTVNPKAGDKGQITMAGALEAAHIQLQAVNNNLAALAINTTGSLRATGTQTNPDGSISLVATGSRGAVTQLDGASLAAQNANGSGGRVEVLGESVTLTGATVIDASARADSSAAGPARDGGTVLIGGDFQGKNAAVRNAKSTSVGKDVRIAADAAQGTAGKGEGGKVIVWADGDTQFAGRISARGGAHGGNGGLVETSGKDTLGFKGLVDTTAAKGKTGTLWLDPTSITISNAADGADISAGPTFSGTAATSNLNVTTLQTALASNNVVVDTTSAAGGDGDITVSNDVTWGGIHSLTLKADRNVNVNAAIAATENGDINLVANQASGGTGDVNVAAAVSTVGGNIAISGVNVTSTSGSLSTNAAADGNAGSVTITATGAVDVGAITAKGGDSTTGVGGNGGAVTMSAGGAVTLGTNSSTNIDTSGGASTVVAGGDAGAVSVTSNGTIWTKAYILARGGDGASGFATGRGGDLSLTNNSTTTGDILFNADLHSTRGQAGNVTVTNKAVGGDVANVDLIGPDNVNLSGANGGSMTVSSQGRVLMIDVNQQGTVRGGDSNIDATDDIAYYTRASGQTPSTPNTNGGDGGNIDITSTGGVISGVDAATKSGTGVSYLSPSGSTGIILSTSGGARTGTGTSGRGGNINLTANQITLFEIATDSNAGTGNGQGGDITINGDINLTGSTFFDTRGQAVAGRYGKITFNGAVNGASASTNLNLATAGDVVFNGAAGNIQAFAITGSVRTFLTYTINGGLFVSSNGIPFRDQKVVFGADATLQNTSGLSTTAIELGQVTANGHAVTFDAGTSRVTANNAGNDFATVNVTSAGIVRLVDTNAITVGPMSASRVEVRAGGDLTLAGNVNATSTLDSIKLQSSTAFINASNHTLTATNGRWLIYSATPTSDTRGAALESAYDFKQYNTAITGTAAQTSGNGFIYSVAPSIAGTLSGTASKTYDGTTSAPTTSLSFSGTGIDGDTVAATNAFSSASYANRNAGSGKTVTATVSGLSGGTMVRSADNKPVYGYTDTSTASAAVGNINAAPITVTALTDTKAFDGTTSSSRSPTVSGLQTGDSIATAATQTYDTSAVGTGKTLTANGLVINDGNSGNNYSVNYVSNNTGVITAAATPNPYIPPVPPMHRVQDPTPSSVQRVSTELGCGRHGVFAGNMKAFLRLAEDEMPPQRDADCPTFQWKDLEADLPPPPAAAPASLSLPAQNTNLVEMQSQGLLRLYASPVLFNTDSAVISAAGRQYLDRFAQAVKTYPEPVDRIEIKGYADITGTPAYNLVLSSNRAKAVQRYLASQDLTYPMLTKGYGDTQPLQDCTGMAKAEAAQCLQANRRVTLGVYIVQQ